MVHIKSLINKYNFKRVGKSNKFSLKVDGQTFIYFRDKEVLLYYPNGLLHSFPTRYHCQTQEHLETILEKYESLQKVQE